MLYCSICTSRAFEGVIRLFYRVAIIDYGQSSLYLSAEGVRPVVSYRSIILTVVYEKDIILKFALKALEIIIMLYSS